MARPTKDEILQRLLARLQKDTQIVDVDPGTIARTFSEILSDEYSSFYDELDLSTMMSFVSTARDQFLDMIGQLLSCTRIAGETDGNYKSRIVNQVYLIAGGNLISIRLAVLSIEGVKDVVTKPYTKGTGSFSVYIITDEIKPSQTLINTAQDAVDKAKSFGVLGEVRTPVLIPVQLKVRLVFSDQASDAEKASIRQSVKQNIKLYIDNIGLGGTFGINEILRNSLATNAKVVDAETLLIKVSGVTQFARNFSVNWDERIVIDSLDVA